jgi:hypothetical protein
MTATYWTYVSDELLPELGQLEQVGLLALGQYAAPDRPGCTLVHMRDEHAPADLEGRVVTPIFRQDYDDDGRRQPLRIIERRPE